jgi:hypothetical protein
METHSKPNTSSRGRGCRRALWSLGVPTLLLAATACTGPVTDKVGTNFRASWIASRAQYDKPYGGYPESRAGRNEFIDDFVSVKNIEFHNYVAAIRRGTSYGQLGADSSRLVLDGLAATTGGAEVKSALAAASAGITGFSSSFQKDVLFDQALPTFIEKMEELRSNKLADITNKKELSIEKYTLSEAYSDVEDYGADGTFDAALRDISAKTGQAASAARSALATAKGDKVSAAASGGGAVQPAPLPPPPETTIHGAVVADAVQASRVAAIKTIKDLNLDSTTVEPFLDEVRQAQDIPTINNIIVQATTAKGNK